MDAGMVPLVATTLTSLGGIIGMIVTASASAKERDSKQDQQNAVFAEKLKSLEQQGAEMKEAIKGIHEIERKLAVQGEKIDNINKRLNERRELA